MTQTKRTMRWLLPAAVLLVLALVFTGLPARAAGEDTTGSTEASVSFEAGRLKLESVPALDFGTQAISYEEKQYAAASVSTNIQVSDLRGNGGGWDLFVSLSPFRLQADGEATLKAAGIRFSSPTVSAVNGTVGTPPTAPADVTLPSDGTETLMWKAGTGEGMGVWSLGWKAADIQNELPRSRDCGVSEPSASFISL